MLHTGKCSKGQVQAWALNRYYYQAMIPLKDALADRAMRGSGICGANGASAWTIMTATRTARRDRALAQADRWAGARPRLRHLDAPAAAGDALRGRGVCALRARAQLLEAVASCLTELFSPQIITERMSGMLENYDYVTPEMLSYFDKRPPQARTRCDFALDYVKQHARTPRTAAGGAGHAEVQVRRAVVHDGRAALRLCDARPDSARRLRARSSEADRMMTGASGTPQAAARRAPALTTRRMAPGFCCARSACSRPKARRSEILQRCDGTGRRTTSSTSWPVIFAADRAVIAQDVTAMLEELAGKGLLRHMTAPAARSACSPN